MFSNLEKFAVTSWFQFQCDLLWSFAFWKPWWMRCYSLKQSWRSHIALQLSLIHFPLIHHGLGVTCTRTCSISRLLQAWNRLGQHGVMVDQPQVMAAAWHTCTGARSRCSQARAEEAATHPCPHSCPHSLSLARSRAHRAELQRHRRRPTSAELTHYRHRTIVQ